jgi:WD40 repeat protein
MRGRSEIEIWEIASKRQLVALYSSSGIAALSWTIDGERLIGAKYQQPMMWDAASGQEIGNLSSQFLGHGDGVILISWMSDGTRLAVINDKGLTIWGAE